MWFPEPTEQRNVVALCSPKTFVILYYGLSWTSFNYATQSLSVRYTREFRKWKGGLVSSKQTKVKFQ